MMTASPVAAMLGLEGQTAIITGAASGQGLATARLMQQLGANVVLTDIAPHVVDVAATVPGAIGFKHDVSDEAEWMRVVEGTVEAFGAVTVLVNNAAVFVRGRMADTPLDMYQRVVNVNQFGSLLGIRAVTDAMRKAGGGSIIVVSSGGALRGGAEGTAYLMTKWALRGLSRCAAAELAEFNIRVNCILPGLIATPMVEVNTPAFNESVVAMTLLKRIGDAGEVASVAAFLASAAASYMTGAEIVVDGGISA